MNSMKLRLLVMGCVLIFLGGAIYFTRGVDIRVLILPIVGIIMLVGGIIYPNRPKQEVATVRK